MTSTMMNYISFDPAHKPGFDEAGSDLASFLDLSFTEASALPLPTATLFSASSAPSAAAPAPAFSNAFANSLRQEDALLESPLGLSPASLTASPFDFAYGDFTSPLLSGAFGTPELDGTPGTPDLGQEDYPSLFGNVSISGDHTWTPAELTQAMIPAPVIAPASGAVSPTLMSLDTELPPLDVAAESPVFTTGKRVPKKSQKELAAEDDASRVVVKDKFTGTRNTKIKPIDFDAPTLPKNYIIPSATSRKRAPAAIASKLTASGKGGKRARRDSTPLPEISNGEMLNPEDLPDELLSAIELKRRQNTLAARRSRMRKAGHLAELQQTIEEKDQRIAALEEELLALRRQLGQ